MHKRVFMLNIFVFFWLFAVVAVAFCSTLISDALLNVPFVFLSHILTAIKWICLQLCLVISYLHSPLGPNSQRVQLLWEYVGQKVQTTTKVAKLFASRSAMKVSVCQSMCVSVYECVCAVYHCGISHQSQHQLRIDSQYEKAFFFVVLLSPAWLTSV